MAFEALYIDQNLFLTKYLLQYLKETGHTWELNTFYPIHPNMPGKKEMIQFEICLLRMAIRDQVYMFLYDVAFAPYIN